MARATGGQAGARQDMTAAIVVGLAAEARIVRQLGWTVAIGGGTARGAQVAAVVAARPGCNRPGQLRIGRRTGSGAPAWRTHRAGRGARGRPKPCDRSVPVAAAGRPDGRRRAGRRRGRGECCGEASAGANAHRRRRSIWRAARWHALPRRMAFRLPCCGRSAIRRSVHCRRPHWPPSMHAAPSGCGACSPRSLRSRCSCRGCSRWLPMPPPRGGRWSPASGR